MIIRMKGDPKELAEFAKAMQLPVVGFGDLEEAIEPEEAKETDRAEVDREIEKLFDAAKAVTGESTQLGTIPIELHRIDLADLRAEANKRDTTGCELAAQIINDWLDKQRKLKL